MSDLEESDEKQLLDLLTSDTVALARYKGLKDYQRSICSWWINSAPTQQRRTERLQRLARRLSWLAFAPEYDLSNMAFSELDALYGLPAHLNSLPPDERRIAIREGRALGSYHYRNFDDGGVLFYRLEPDHKAQDDVMLVYARPCVLTGDILRALNYNNWDNIAEIRDIFGVADKQDR